MKKILLLSTFLLMGILSNAQVQRTVLIEEFTNASCNPCAGQNPVFNRLLANNPTKVVSVKYQVSFPGRDAMNAQNPTEVASRAAKYKVTGVPFAAIDGDTLKNPKTNLAYAGAPFNVTQALIDKEYALSTPLSLTTTFNYDAAKDSITSVVTIKNMSTTAVKASSLNQLKLVFALLEMNINYATAPGSNGETDFFYVMRKMYPNQAGTQLPDSLAADSSFTFTFKIKPPAYIYKKEQMAVVAFVQDFGTNKVYQAGIGLPTGLIDADITYTGTVASTNYCATVITNPKVKITNKGVLPLTSAKVGALFNGVPTGAVINWSGNLATGQSADVILPNINAAFGTNVYKYYATALNTNGIDVNEGNNQLSEISSSVIDKAKQNTETFESSLPFDPYGAESINNNEGSSFVINNSIFATGSPVTQKLGAYGKSDNSYFYDFYSIRKGIRIGLLSYKYNLKNTGFTTINFDYAYNNYFAITGSDYDTLALKISKDCGLTWEELWKKAGVDLRTTNTAGDSIRYWPAITEWKTATVTIPSTYKNETEVEYMLEGQSGYGNSLFVDNISLGFATATKNLNLDNAISVYPNPVNDKINIVGIEGDAQVALIDIYGRTIQTMQLKNNVGTATFNVDGFVTGNYLLRITHDGDSITKSIMIK
jgi:hypothetical protein